MASQMITAKEVADILQCSERHGSNIIKRLNEEMDKKGYITIRGKVSRRYFLERTGILEEGQTHETQAQDNLLNGG